MKYTKIINFQMVMHLSGELEHVLCHTGEIDCPDHIQHGKKVLRHIVTPVTADHGGPKEFGKAEVYWSIEGLEDKENKTVQELLLSVGLPEIDPEQIKTRKG